GEIDRHLIFRLRGVIGEDIASPFVSLARDAARDLGVERVIIDLDTPGGSVHEAQVIQSRIRSESEIEWAVYCRDVISAGIWIAFAADEMLFHPSGTFGGALAYSSDAAGNFEVDAKFNSIAAAKVIADMHRPELAPVVRAMMISNAELWVSESVSGSEFFNAKPDSASGLQTSRLNRSGAVLTLSASEASRLGLGEIHLNAEVEGKNVVFPVRREVSMVIGARLQDLAYEASFPAMRQAYLEMLSRADVRLGGLRITLADQMEILSVIKESAKVFPQFARAENPWDGASVLVGARVFEALCQRMVFRLFLPDLSPAGGPDCAQYATQLLSPVGQIQIDLANIMKSLRIEDAIEGDRVGESQGAASRKSDNRDASSAIAMLKNYVGQGECMQADVWVSRILEFEIAAVTEDQLWTAAHSSLSCNACRRRILEAIVERFPDRNRTRFAVMELEQR
ncbi:hypothetical protein N9411_00820, partial [bacterium]|nr:hypothetical protein [bacterium]